MAKRPRISEPRKVRQPFSIDLLPMDTLESIKRLRNRHGMSWPEIERLSSLPYDEGWESKKNFGKCGFVNWDELPTKALEAFPDLRLPHSNLYRWYVVKVEQAQKEMLAGMAQAREIVREMAAAGVVGSDEAVLNATRDLVFGLMESTDEKSRIGVSALLIELGKVQQRARTNDLRQGQLTQETRRIDLLEKKLATMQRGVKGLRDEAARKNLSPEQLQMKLDEIYGIGA